MDRGAWWATVQRVAKEVDMTERLNNHHLILRKYQRVSSLRARMQMNSKVRGQKTVRCECGLGLVAGGQCPLQGF